MSILYFIIVPTLFIIDKALEMPPGTYFSHLTSLIYLFIYLSIYLYMSDMILYCYCLSLTFIDRLDKNRIFFSLFIKT